MKNFLILVMVAALFLFGCNKQEKSNFEKSLASLDEQFEEYEIVTLDVSSIVTQTVGQYSESLTLNLGMEEKPEWVFNVKYHDFYHKDYTLYESNAQGDWVEVLSTDRSDAYHGLSVNKAHRAMFVIRENEFTATIFEDGRELFIEPLSNYIEGSPADQYIYYFVEGDKTAAHHTCGVSEEEIRTYQQNVQSNSNGAARADQCRDMSITYVADYQYRGKFSNNTTNTRNYIEDRIKFASYRYWNYNDYPLYFNLYNAYIRTTTSNAPTTSTNSSTALSQFRTWARANISTRDCSLLFTGRNFGSLYGRAYVGVVCKYTSGKKRAFGLVTKNSGVSSGTYNKVTAHEVGHTLGCSHQTSGFMKQGNHSNTGMATATEQELDAYISSNNSCIPLRTCVNFD